MKEKIQNFRDFTKSVWPIAVMSVAVFLCMALGMCDFVVMPG